jgi:hypothetical protein
VVDSGHEGLRQTNSYKSIQFWPSGHGRCRQTKAVVAAPDDALSVTDDG